MCAINGRRRQNMRAQMDRKMRDERIYNLEFTAVNCARLRRLGMAPNLRCPILRGNWVACGLLKRTISLGRYDISPLSRYFSKVFRVNETAKYLQTSGSCRAIEKNLWETMTWWRNIEYKCSIINNINWNVRMLWNNVFIFKKMTLIYLYIY